jgi:hypothetical protein
MQIYRILLFALCLLLVLAMTGTVNGARRIIPGEDSTSEKLTERTEEPKPVREQRLEVDELSETEQLIVDKLKKKRTESTKCVLEVNPRISGVIRYEMQMLFEEESAGSTSEQAEERLDKMVSYLGGSTVIIEAESTERVLNQLNQNEKLQKEVEDSTNLVMAIGLTRTTNQTDSVCCLIHFCKYLIEWGPSPVPAGGHPVGFEKGSPIFNWGEIKGKCNAKYLKYDFYQGIGFPFRIEKDSVETEMLETDQDRNFSFRISYLTRSKMEQRRIAILARESPSEAYSLVDFLHVGGIFP